jgi:hypothetical protein
MLALQDVHEQLDSLAMRPLLVELVGHPSIQDQVWQVGTGIRLLNQ